MLKNKINYNLTHKKNFSVHFYICIIFLSLGLIRVVQCCVNPAPPSADWFTVIGDSAIFIVTSILAGRKLPCWDCVTTVWRWSLANATCIWEIPTLLPNRVESRTVSFLIFCFESFQI